MRKLKITAAKDRYDRGIRVQEVSWSKLAERLQKFKVTPETFEEYLNAGNDKLAIKDCGWFIGGPMDPPERRKANLVHRDVLCLDADHLDSWDVGGLIAHFEDEGYEFVCHSSHSHSEDEPRLRFVFPFSRPVEPREYEAIARMVAGEAGIDMFDDTTYQVSRVMFLPSRSVDGDEFSHHAKGKPVDPDEVLGQYGDWRDWGSWPVSSREQQLSRDPSKKAEDPYTKPGAIGAFNRLFEVPYAIEKFDLPYVPSGMGEDRYSYAGGSSVDGAIYYPDDGHLYSWHESDPARGNRNAWDLVRLHRFGDLDAGMADDTPVAQLESQKAMLAFAMGIPDVATELAADDGLTPLGDPDPEEDGPPARLDRDSIRSRILGRNSPISDAERHEITREIAAANLTAADISVLAALLKSGHEDPAPSKQAIIDEVKQTRSTMLAQTESGNPVDIELDLIERVLDDWFEGGKHIKRFARQFWTYEHGVWIRREDEYIRGLMQRSFIQLRKERPKEVMALVAAIGENDTSSITAKLWTMFCSHITGADPTEDPMRLMNWEVRPVINVRNGHIEFNRRGEYRLVKHDPSLFLTSQIPYDFDPDADTSHWDAFCELVFHDSLEPDDMQRHLEEVGGYIIQPWRDLATFFLMRGEPAAGKSTFGSLLNTMLGKSILNKEMARFEGGNNHDTAGLVGKLLLLDEDFNKGDLLPAGFVKRISEAKQLTANPKNKDEFEFINRAVPFVISNDWPPTRDHSGALDRRLVCWDLPAIPTDERDDDARRSLLREGVQGSLLRFVEGFARLYQRQGWLLPDDCVVAGERWLQNTDVVASFVTDTMVEAPDAWIPRTELLGYFREWYREAVPGAKSVGKIELYRRLRVQFGPELVRGGVRGWTGFRYVGSEFEPEVGQ